MKPTLIIAGRQDTGVGYRDLYKILDNFPNGTFAVLDNGKHDIQIEQEDIFNVLVKEWIYRIEYYKEEK